MPKMIYLVIPTDHIGGAEKRFLKIWLELKEQYQTQLQLILLPKLLKHAIEQPELADLETHGDSINATLLTGNSRLDIRSLKHFADSLTEKSLFHFVSLPPYRRSSKHQYLFSFPASGLGMHSYKGIISILLGCLHANRIDVLSPSVVKVLKQLLWFKRDCFSQTPGSLVDFGQYSFLPFIQKCNDLVFLGLLSREKQPDRLLQCIPELHESLAKQGFENLRYRFLGRATDQFDLKSMIEGNPRLRELPIQVGFEKNPHEVLSASKVFFSVQRTDNYPSKSLLEAIACGNQIVVTDVGASEMIAPRSTCYYIPREFVAADLVPICSEILSLSAQDYMARALANLEFVKSRHSLSSSLDYFRSFYEK